MKKEISRRAFKIETISPKYAEQILDFRRKIYEENEPTTLYTTKRELPTIGRIRERAKISEDKPAAFLAMKGDAVIGEIFANKRLETGEIDIRYAVSKEARGTGVIYALLYTIAVELDKQGIKEIFAEAFNTNIASLKVLEKLGGKVDSFDTYYDEKRDIHHKSTKYSIGVSELKRNAKAKLAEYPVD